LISQLYIVFILAETANITTARLLAVGVPPEYDGPHLINGQVTEEFMEDLLIAFRDCKKLHQKYAYQVSCNPQYLFYSHFCT